MSKPLRPARLMAAFLAAAVCAGAAPRQKDVPGLEELYCDLLNR